MLGKIYACYPRSNIILKRKKINEALPKVNLPSFEIGLMGIGF